MAEHRTWVLIAVLGSQGCAQGVTPDGPFESFDTRFEPSEPVESDTDEPPDAGGPSPPGPCIPDAPNAPCFRASMLLSVSPDARAPSIADVTGDGVDDLVLANAAVGTVQVLSGPWWEGFEREVVLEVGAAIGSVTTADLDGDGVHDVVVYERGTSEISVFWGGPDLGGPPWRFELPGVPVAMDHRRSDDGPRDELVLGFEDGTLRRFDLAVDPAVDPGAGPVLTLPDAPIQIAPVHTADPDIVSRSLVTVDDAGMIAIARAPEMSDALVVQMGAAAAALGDITGDGRLDLAFRGHEGPPLVVLGVEEGAWMPARALAPLGTAVAMTLADLDRNGSAEIVWADDEGLLHIGGWRGDELIERLSLQLDAVPTALATGDLDDDGWADIVAVYAATRSVEIFARRR
jgi:hypothetical protein